MTRIFTTAAISLALLAGCGDGTNPFMDAPDGETAPTEPGADTDPDNIYATDMNDDLTMNAFQYNDNGTADPTDDTLLINNIPFDNSDASGGGYTPVAGAALDHGFDLYESPSSGGAADRRYFAVFRQATYSEVAAVGTGDYVTFGFGGATAQRRGTNNGIPAERPAYYTFTGDYAAVRITTISGGTGDVEYITGDATFYVDIPDFDVNGAVEGIIDNRVLYDVNGTPIAVLNDYVSLATGEIDFTTGIIGPSEAYGLEAGGEISSGSWQGVFAGPNGEEIAGIVVLEGSVTDAEPDDSVRETGVFIVVNTE